MDVHLPGSVALIRHRPSASVALLATELDSTAPGDNVSDILGKDVLPLKGDGGGVS